MKDYTARDRKQAKKGNRMKTDKEKYGKRDKQRRSGNSERARTIRTFENTDFDIE